MKSSVAGTGTGTGGYLGIGKQHVASTLILPSQQHEALAHSQFQFDDPNKIGALLHASTHQLQS